MKFFIAVHTGSTLAGQIWALALPKSSAHSLSPPSFLSMSDSHNNGSRRTVYTWIGARKSIYVFVVALILGLIKMEFVCSLRPAVAVQREIYECTWFKFIPTYNLGFRQPWFCRIRMNRQTKSLHSHKIPGIYSIVLGRPFQRVFFSKGYSTIIGALAT